MGSSTYALTVTKVGAGTVTSAPAGIDCGATCTASYASGTSVTLTATPAAGSAFSGWSGACSGTGSCQVTMSAARAVTATFSAPSLAVADIALNEGNTGSTNATFTVTLSPASSGTVTVNYATANGTATAGTDYTATSGTLTFTPGQTSQTVAVPVLGDTAIEANETFTLTLSSASGAALSRAVATATITNDDFPALSIGDVTVNEGNSGTTSAVFTVTLSATSPQTVTVNFATANGTATAGSDYVAQTGNLSFTTGQTSKTISRRRQRRHHGRAQRDVHRQPLEPQQGRPSPTPRARAPSPTTTRRRFRRSRSATSPSPRATPARPSPSSP